MFEKLSKPQIVIYKGRPRKYLHFGMTGEATHATSESVLVNFHGFKNKLPQEVNDSDLHFTEQLMICVK